MSDVQLRRRSVVFPAPTLDSKARPVDWEKTSETAAAYGSLGLFVNDEDVTNFRDVATVIERVSWADPLGPESLAVRFPQITPYEALGTGDLDWLTDFANVRLERYDANGDPVIGDGWPWFGLFAEANDRQDETSASLGMNCFGSLYQMNLYLKRPENINAQVDVGELLFRALWPRLHKAYRFTLENGDDLADPATDAPVLGVLSNYRGNWEPLTDYVRKLLQLVPDWTVVLDETNEAKIVARNTDVSTIDWTVRAAQPGVSTDLVRSSMLSPNAIFGQGVATDGTTWSNLFPFDDATPEGALVYQPLAYDPEVNPYDEDVDGDLVIDLDRLVEEKIKHETKMDFGQGVGIVEAKAIASDIYTRMATPGYAGTVTLRADPNEGHRLDIRPDHGLRLQSHRGVNRDFYVARAEARIGEGGDIAVTCSVDTHARDALLIDAIMEGNRQRVRNPVPQLITGRRRPDEDTGFMWDRLAGSGQIPNDDVVGRRWVNPINRVEAAADEWTIYRFLASERDSIRLTIFDTDPATTFHVSIYNFEPDPLDLPIDPFAEGTWDEPPDGHVIGWGGFEQRAGYWPGLESEGDSVTGVMRDEGVWQFAHDEVDEDERQPPFLWVAFWPDDDTFFGGELYRGVGTQI